MYIHMLREREREREKGRGKKNLVTNVRSIVIGNGRLGRAAIYIKAIRHVDSGFLTRAGPWTYFLVNTVQQLSFIHMVVHQWQGLWSGARPAVRPSPINACSNLSPIFQSRAIIIDLCNYSFNSFGKYLEIFDLEFLPPSKERNR